MFILLLIIIFRLKKLRTIAMCYVRSFEFIHFVNVKIKGIHVHSKICFLVEEEEEEQEKEVPSMQAKMVFS